MKTFVKPIALLGLAGALIAGAQAAEARDAAAFTSANNASYYINGAYAYETAPAYRAAPVTAPAYAAVPARQRGFESYAYAPQSFGAPVRPDDVYATQQRHLDGTE
jgi:hypothetical protein